MSSEYESVKALCDAGEMDKAWRIIKKILTENPNHPGALVSAGHIACRTEHFPESYHFLRSACQIAPHDAPAWMNWGHACSLMSLHDEAERHYLRALKLCKSIEDQKVLWVNLSALYIDCGQFEKAEVMTRKILEVDPTQKSALSNLGFCQLARRDWQGWKGYHNTIGTDWRPKVQYNGEPEWDGSPGKRVALYSDQGLGDEISFASMVPDALDVCQKLILDCDSRLESLFQRSFPLAKVYGTRGAKDAKWDKSDWEIDASLPLGQIGEFFRTDDRQFSGKPYLIPCPTRTAMWKAKFKKPVIGVAWTGGTAKNNGRNRKVSLEDLLPVFALDAHYVSLQYKDAAHEIKAFKAKHGVDLEQYRFATLTNDYDDTAALIAACDYVVCIQTAVAHTAGALGVPVMVLVPTATQWRYGNSQDTVPWYKSLRVIRQKRSGEWKHEIERAAGALQAHFGRLQEATGTSAQNDHLRHEFSGLRANGVGHRESVGGYSPS